MGGADDEAETTPVADGNVLFLDGDDRGGGGGEGVGVDRDQAGEYACVAENRHGRVEARTRLQVQCE